MSELGLILLGAFGAGCIFSAVIVGVMLLFSSEPEPVEVDEPYDGLGAGP